ncbi:MAG: sugar phosphate isomerase/epimerase family protein, partial [Geminicoccaceae bacterium]
ICSARALQYTVHGPLGVNFMDEERLDLHKAVARAMLEVSGALGASAMVLHAGVVAARPLPELERLHAIERDALFETGEIAARHGVRLALENLFVEKPGRYTADPARLAEQIAKVDHGSVCGTLDFSHAYIMTTLRGLDFAPAIEAFAPYVNHLHLHDSFGLPNTLGRFYTHAEQIAFGIGDIHLPMGWGDIDWGGILPGLRLRPATVMIVELMPRHWSEIDEVAATARRFVEIVNRAQAS